MTQHGQEQLRGLLARLLSLIILFAGVVLSLPSRSARAAGGDPDPAFDGDGRRTFVSSTTEDRGLAVAVQTNGKIVVVGDTDFFGTLDAPVLLALCLLAVCFPVVFEAASAFLSASTIMALVAHSCNFLAADMAPDFFAYPSDEQTGSPFLARSLNRY